VEPGEPSASIRERVEAARQIQRERFRKCNADMTSRQLRKHCELDPPSRRLLIAAIERLGLSARGHDRILKVARTIADLAGTERVDSGHLAEAVQYRALDRAYFR
jgi:magnesium chelatase family protein